MLVCRTSTLQVVSKPTASYGEKEKTSFKIQHPVQHNFKQDNAYAEGWIDDIIFTCMSNRSARQNWI